MKNDDYKAVIRDLTTGFRAEAPLPALLDRALMAWARLWRWRDLAARALRRLAPGLAVGRRPGEKPLVAVDMSFFRPGPEHDFVLGLLEAMAAMAPDWTFALVAGPETLRALRGLEGPNVKAVQAEGKWLAAPPLKLLGRPVDAWFCPFARPRFQHEATPLVSMIHGLGHAAFPHLFEEAELREREQSFQLAVRRSARLACVSESVRREALEHSNLPPGRVRVVTARLSGAEGASSRDGAAICVRFGLAPGGFLIYPADFTALKNHGVLLTALGIFAKSQPGSTLKLVLAGEDSGAARELHAAAKSMGLSDRVAFTGRLSGAELSALMAVSLALVFPSLYEGFAAPVAMAQLMGVPVLCSDAPGPAETAGDAALFFDHRKPEDLAAAIERVATEDGLATDLAERGRRRAASRGAVRDMARECLELLDEAVRAIETQSAVCEGVSREAVSPRVFAAFGPVPGRQRIEAVFRNGGGEPLEYEASLDGKPLGSRAVLAPGARLRIGRLASPYGGCLEIAFGPSGTDGPVPGLVCEKLALEGAHTFDLLGSA